MQPIIYHYPKNFVFKFTNFHPLWWLFHCKGWRLTTTRGGGWGIKKFCQEKKNVFCVFIMRFYILTSLKYSRLRHLWAINSFHIYFHSWRIYNSFSKVVKLTHIKLDFCSSFCLYSFDCFTTLSNNKTNNISWNRNLSREIQIIKRFLSITAMLLRNLAMTWFWLTQLNNSHSWKKSVSIYSSFNHQSVSFR